MSFIVDGVGDALEHTLHKIQRNEDEGATAIRPDFDQKQHQELIAEQVQGQDAERINERFRQCLEYHGFRFLRPHQLPRLRGRFPRTEGEWRHKNYPAVRLAFTPRDLASGFRGGEDLDKYLRDQKLVAAVTRGKVEKEALAKSRSRKS